MVHNPLHLPRKTTSEPPKVVRTPQFFTLLTSKCASRHNGLHFLDISTSKSGDLEMCFAPQRRALFQLLKMLKKCSGPSPSVFLHFCLGKVLRATTACNFSCLIWPHASAPVASLSLLFDPPQRQIIGKHTVTRDFRTFSRTCIFFLLTLSPLSSHLCFSNCPYCRTFHL